MNPGAEPPSEHAREIAELSLPWLTLPGMLDSNFRRFSHRCALEDGECRLSYRQLRSLVCGVSSGLAGSGIAAGDRVVLWGPNSWRWVVAALACWWRGATVVPVSSQAKMLEAVPLIRRVNPSALFIDESRHDSAELESRLVSLSRTFSLREAGPGSFETIHDLASRPGRSGGSAAPAQVQPEDCCELLFTSGSTGTPKAVIRTHEQVIRNRHWGSQRRGFLSTDALLALAPFSHTLGLNGTLLRGLMLGAKVVITRESSPRAVADIIQKCGISAISAPPSLFETLLDLERDSAGLIRRLRLLSIGSAARSEDLITRLIQAGAGSIACGYGMTECDSISSATSSMGLEVLATTVGEPEPGVDVRVADDNGFAVGREVAGEIQVRGYCTTPGYFEDPATSEALYTDDGWLKTGDIGRWTAAGHLQVLGRRKEVINAHGYTVYPAEVEQLMLQSNMLRAIAVYGLTHAAGEACAAAVVPLDPENFDLRLLMAWARKNLTGYKVPVRVQVVAQLPVNSNGKIDRRKLQGQYAVTSHD